MQAARRNRAVSRRLVAGFAVLAASVGVSATAFAQAAPRVPRTIEDLITSSPRSDVSLPPPVSATPAPAAAAPASAAPAAATPDALAPTLTANETPVATALQGALATPPTDRSALPVFEAVRRLYRARGFAPAWLNDGAIGERAQALLEMFEQSTAYGFTAADYRVGELRALASESAPDRVAQFELLLTRSVLRFAVDIQGGRVSTINIPREARPQARAVDGGTTLAAAAAAADPRATLLALAPQTPEYTRLVEALRREREMAAAGGWPTVPTGPTIEPGAQDPRVGAVRARLATYDGAAPASPTVNANLYDPELVAVVKHFQRRHGIAEDGRIGRLTVASLNQTAEWRVQQILVNLDRLRAMPARGDVPEIVVNIPEFRVRVFEGNNEVINMAVVVGRDSRPTPLLTSRVVEIIFNPTWTVPLKVAREDLIPRFRRNAADMASKGFRMFRSWGPGAEEIDVTTFDWHSVNPERFGYMIRQDSGPRNALGQLRLTLVNTPDIYMHDTPDRAYFQRDMRALSSGCVRLERPAEMVEYVLRRNAGTPWTQAAIRDHLAANHDRNAVGVARPVTVHLTYFTAWVNPDGEVQFREDIYGLDNLIARAQEQRPVVVVAQSN
jgi:murein L,D-transpeptidase YcbB/YkuD